MEFPIDLFISYSSKDKKLSTTLCQYLEKNGIRCWIAPRNIRPGFVYGSEIVSAIKSCRMVILVFTENSNISPHVANEIDLAFRNNKIIIPLRMDDIPPSESLEYYLSNKQWIDVNKDDEDKFADLLSGCKKLLEREETPDQGRSGISNSGGKEPVKSPTDQGSSQKRFTDEIKAKKKHRKLLFPISLILISIFILFWIISEMNRTESDENVKEIYTPEDAITDYWRFVSKHSYDSAWHMLTVRRQEFSNNDFGKFVTGLERLRLCSVEVVNSRLIRQIDLSVEVSAHLDFYSGEKCYKSGQDFIFYLIYDEQNKKWLLDKVEEKAE